jgi:CHASE3 domain sensor protein
MDIFKKIIFVLVILFIVVLAWVVTSVYWQQASLDIDSEATNYTKPLKKSFDEDVLIDISEKTLNSYPVSPQEFLRLNAD